MNTPGDAARGPRGRPWCTLAALTLGAMTVSLDGTVVAIAQPAIQEELGASLSDVQWMTAGYLLALAALLVPAGKLGDRFGHRRLFLVGTTGFTLSSAAIGLSAHIAWIIALRVVQGVFGALMQPPTLALLRAAFPADRLSMPIAVRSSALGLATAAGPVVGGLLVEHIGWQSVFFLNVPLGAVTFGLGRWVLREARPDPATRSDPVAAVLLCAALLALLWAVVGAPAAGWGDTRTVATLLGAAVLGAGFCLWEQRAAEPMVPLSLFRSPTFTAGVVLMTLVSFILFGVPLVLVFFLQNVLGMSPMESGVEVLWLTLGMTLAGTVAGLVMRRTGPRIPAVLGMAATTAGVLGVWHADATSTMSAQLRLSFALLGLGFSSVIVASTHLIVGGAPLRHSGLAGGIQQTAMQIGGSLGSAVLGAVVAARVDRLLPERLSDDGVPLSGAALADAVRSVSTGLTPDSFQTAELIRLGHQTYADGMDLALLGAAALAALGTAVGAVPLLRRTVPAPDAARGPATPEPDAFENSDDRGTS
ncbi:MFS transporter [Streptomyces sp. NPDC049627]|uniref:MFS transporter n=1 Tax=Streptomyces sp. NPDC049627 TaxID=3365595 RepID=UPI0037BD4EE1